MNENGHNLLPPLAASSGQSVDHVFAVLHWITLFFFVLIFVLMVVFVIRYRRRSEADTTPDIAHNNLLETVWTIIPLIILMVLFVVGFRSYMNMRVAPYGAREITVTGKKWFWQFDYPDGPSVVNELVVPVGEPFRLNMISEDVIHSFFVPAFRIKQDVLPNRYSVLWAEPSEVGEFHLFCTEYCGTGHADMIGTVRVLPVDEFEEWLETGGLDPSEMSLEEYGAALFKRNGCTACHNIEGRDGIGPHINGIFGKEEQVVVDGEMQTITVDENYLRESILVPGAKIVNGYENAMPTYQGLLEEREVTALVAYIKSLQ